jgi:hypothetical protein
VLDITKFQIEFGFYYYVVYYGMLMFRFSKAHATRLESTSVACDKVGERVWPCISNMRIKNLAVEAHFDCKRLDNPIGNWPSFQCKFYKVCMKDKNIFLIIEWWTIGLLTREGPLEDVPNLGQMWNKENY